MNISVYLPKHLNAKFESFTKRKGISRSAAIRKAIELLLKSEKKSEWGDWLNQLEADQEIEPFESHRKALKPPHNSIF